MNHYPHHIGDFNNATRHLTRVERSLYRDMLELYYDTEQPLNSDTTKIARRVLATSDEEKEALTLVLEEFFVLQDDGWHNSRCDAEIAKYQGQIEQASRAGKASAAKRYGKALTTVEQPLNQPEPEPEPEPSITPADKSAPIPPGFAKFWETWPTNDRKQAKGKCLDAWKKAHAERDAALVIDHVLSLKNGSWTKDAGQFIPAPLTYLNGRRWEGAEASGQPQGGIFAGAI
jgi:uncharacterized protein YdaU (DUF1376 family)